MSLKLSAINSMLATIPLAPETNLDSPTNLKTSIALAVLEEVKQEVLTEAEWKVATRPSVSLEPSESGQILLNERVLSVIPSETDRQNGRSYIARGTVLFDVANDTTTFTSPVTVSLTENLEYEQLSPKLRDYVKAKAKRRFHRDIVNNADKNRMLMEEEDDARHRAYREDTIQNRVNLFTANATIRDRVTRRQNPYPRY